MNKNNSSKKNTVEQLYKILDDDSKKTQSPKDEKILRSLSIRLKSSGDKIELKPKVFKGIQEKDVYSLEPKVIVHVREKKKIVYKKEKPKEKPYEKDLLEVEKVDMTAPKFIEVTPEISTKPKIKISKKEKIPEAELVEWEEVDVKSTESEKINDEIFEKVTTEPVEFIEKIDNEIIETPSTFGKLRKGKKKKEPYKIKINGKKEEEIEEISVVEEIPIDTKSMPEEPDLDFAKKIETFKDYVTIDERTAILLYNNGFTTTESLKNATIKDIRKIKGIKRRTAKKIRKEIDEKIQDEKKVKMMDINKSVEEEIKEEKPEEFIEEELPSPEELEARYSEWEKIESNELGEKEFPIKIAESIEERNKKIETFKDYQSIDEETAILLHDNGYSTIESLKNASVQDLRNIKGIKRRIAKKIKKETDEKIQKEEKEKIIDMGKNIEEEIEEEESKTKEDTEEQNKKIEIFKDYKSVNERTAILLFDNGYVTVESLKNVTLEDLRKIKGIKRRTAKKIKKEIDEKIEEEVAFEDIKNIEKDVELLTLSKKKASKPEKKQTKGLTRNGYTLYEKKIKTKSGKRVIRFFSKSKPKAAVPIELPKNFKVLVNKKTGAPYLKKKK